MVYFFIRRCGRIENDNFRERVSAYQTGGDRTVIEKIRHYLHTKADIRRVDSYGEEHEVYIAVRINTITFPERRALKYDAEALYDFREAINGALGVDIYDTDNFLRNAYVIHDFLGSDAYESLMVAIERHIKYEAISSFLIIPALEYALRRVDTERSAREMVVYINRAFRSEYQRRVMDYTGTKRLGRRDEHGRFTSVYVKPLDNPSAWSIVFEQEVSECSIEEILVRLTVSQRERARLIHQIVAGDVESGDMSEYRVTESGNYRIKARYIARKIGIEESNLRKYLLSLRKRIAKNVPTFAY